MDILDKFYKIAAKSTLDLSLLHGPADDAPYAEFEIGKAYTGAREIWWYHWHGGCPRAALPERSNTISALGMRQAAKEIAEDQPLPARLHAAFGGALARSNYISANQSWMMTIAIP